MKMDFNLNLIQEQKLIMTQEMQLSVKLLQMSTFELQQYISKELQENPVLDVEYEGEEQADYFKENVNYKELIKYFDFDNYSDGRFEKNEEQEVSPFNFISEKKSLKNFLEEQIIELTEDDFFRSICMYIVENLDGRGYLDCSIEEIAENLKISGDLAEKALTSVQALEPSGVGARNLKECLKIQVKAKKIEDENILKIIDDYLEYIGDNKYSRIAKELNIDIKKAQKYGDFIKTLQPKPSMGFFTGEEIKYTVPDAFIKKIQNEYYIIMNDGALPRLTISSIYKDIVCTAEDKTTVEYVKNKINNALFLIKSIDQRKSTIYKVLEKILELQMGYFELGESYLRPMTLKEIANSLGIHESTVSRAIRDKYIYTNKGTVKIKDLFTTGIASAAENEDISVRAIKNMLRTLIDKEDKNRPLSDQVLSDILNQSDMNISRRTVAKYREEMNIKSSSKRKRF